MDIIIAAKYGNAFDVRNSIHLFINRIDLEDEKSALHYAAENGDIEIVDILLKYGANINIVNSYNITPLHYAIKNNHFNVVKLLIENGADIEIDGDEYSTPLCTACGSIGECNLEIAKYLLDKGSKINESLHHSSIFEHFEIVKLLIQYGADINAQSYRGTPLHCACSVGNFEIVKLLIENGADINAKDLDGKTPLYSSSNPDEEIVKYFLDKGANNLIKK